MKKISCIFLFILILNINPCYGDVYKNISPDGKVTYSSSPKEKDSKPAVLPEIKKEKFEVKDYATKSCFRHGGIDCQKGQDTDNSVICVDGFRDASQPYAFNCSSPKLEITEIKKEDNGIYKVFIRNFNSVRAKDVKVKFFPDLKKLDDLKIGEGGTEIEPNGFEEYIFKLDSLTGNILDLNKESFKIACGNCGG